MILNIVTMRNLISECWTDPITRFGFGFGVLDLFLTNRIDIMKKPQSDLNGGR